MSTDLRELLGFALLVTFAAVVWWPSALLVAGCLLILSAVADERTPKAPSPASDTTDPEVVA